MSKSVPYTFDRVVRIIITIVILIGIFWLIKTLKDVLLPFFVACLVAYMFEPFVQFNRRLLNLRGRTAAIFVTLSEAVFFAGIIGYFVMPLIFDEMHRMSQILTNYSNTHTEIRFLPQELHDYLRRNVDFNQLSQLLSKQEWASVIDKAINATWNIITGSISVIVGLISWFIVLLYIVFIMLDYERINRGIRHMVPPSYRAVTFRIADDIKRSMNHYFRGQALVAFIVGVLFAIGFSIVGIPMAVVLGLFIGVLNLVPYLQLISVIPTTLLCLVYAAGGGGDFWVIFWECTAVYAIVQAIQDLILTPKIMGKAMGLNPAIILLSLSIWGTLLGLIGLIIALPLTTLLIAYYNEFIIERDKAGGDNPGQLATTRRDLDNMVDSSLD